MTQEIGYHFSKGNDDMLSVFLIGKQHRTYCRIHDLKLGVLIASSVLLCLLDNVSVVIAVVLLSSGVEVVEEDNVLAFVSGDDLDKEDGL